MRERRQQVEREARGAGRVPLVELVDREAEPRGAPADLVQRREPERAVERRVLDPLRHHRPRRLLEPHHELLVHPGPEHGLLEEQDPAQLLRHVRARDLLAIRVLDQALVRPHVRAVDVERRQREREVLDLDLLVEPPQLRLEDVDGDLELRELGHVLEAARVAGQLLVERRERVLRVGVHVQRHHVVQELVARRPLHRPVAQLLAGLEDLLRPHVLDARVREPLEVLRRDPRARPGGRRGRRRRGPPAPARPPSRASPRRPPSPPASRRRARRCRRSGGGSPSGGRRRRTSRAGGGRARTRSRRPPPCGSARCRGSRRARRRRARGTRPRRRARPRSAAGRRRRSRASSPRAPGARARGRGARSRGRAGRARARAPRGSRTRA